MGTRFELLEKIRNLGKLVMTGEHSYNKLIRSGELADTHFDYNVGYYDVSMYYLCSHKRHYVRVRFGTIDDGDFGAWVERGSKEKALELLEELKNRFSEIDSCPNHEELNKKFMDLGVYFCLE